MMKLFLSQSYPIEKAALPTKNIKNALVGELAQMEMGGILDFIPDKATQSPFLADLRLQLSEKCDYSADYMLHEFQKVRERHGDWTQFGNSLAYVTLVPEQNSVAIFTKGTLKIARFREGSTLLFETDGNPRLEPTQTGDIWLIFQHNADAPTDKTPSPIENFVYDYIIKSVLEKSYPKNFHILYVENQIDITQSAAIPTANERMGKGGLTIAKQLLAAEQPFSKVEPLLTVLSRHEFVGNEAKDLWTKYAPIIEPKPLVVEPKPPVVEPKPPVVPPKPPTVEPKETTVEPTEPSTLKLKPYMIGGAIVLAVIGASNLYDMRTPQSPREPQIIVPPKDSAKIQPSLSPVPTKPSLQKPDLVKREIPSVPQPSPTTPPSNQPPIAPMPKPITPAPQPVKTEAQTHLEKAMDLFNDAKLSIEKNPFNINKALLELHLAEQNGLDAKAYLEKSNEITDFKKNTLDKLQKEAANLSKSAETMGRQGEAKNDAAMKNNAVKIFETAQKKLELEHKIQPSDNLNERLKTVQEKIDFFSDKY